MSSHTPLSPSASLPSTEPSGETSISEAPNRAASGPIRAERRISGGRRATDRRAADRDTDPVSSVLMVDEDDQLAPFGPAILAVRWASTVACIALAWKSFVIADFTVVPWAMAVIANTTIRTVTPLKYDRSMRATLNLLLEVGLHLLAVAATGFWHSPLVFSLVTAVIVAAFARGFGFGIRIAVASSIAISSSSLIRTEWTSIDVALAAQWSTVLILGGIVAGYARRISWEATQEHSLALDRLTRLSDANTLLTTLHRVAQTLPSSLDSSDVLDSTVQRLRGLLDFDAAVILTTDENDEALTVAKRTGVKTPVQFRYRDLPTAARRALITRSLLSVEATRDTVPGFLPDAAAALFAPLLARGTVVGLLALEKRDPRPFSNRDLEVLRAFVEPTALAIDNARWFARIRTVGADEERTRIARDLHDRIGQSLAYLAFELDRVVRRNDQGEPVGENLESLRADLRTVVGEVRDTLYDLRTDVGREKDFATTMDEFAGRVAERAELDIDLDCEKSARLPILQEREMWRIAQEALINVERHADASTVMITWRCNGSSAELAVVDDGRGFDSKDGRVDSYGMLGMRERAASIGAALNVISHRGEGTTVRCSLKER